MQKLNHDEKTALEKFAVKNRKNVLRLMKAGRMGHIGLAESAHMLADVMGAGKERRLQRELGKTQTGRSAIDSCFRPATSAWRFMQPLQKRDFLTAPSSIHTVHCVRN